MTFWLVSIEKPTADYTDANRSVLPLLATAALRWGSSTRGTKSDINRFVGKYFLELQIIV